MWRRSQDGRESYHVDYPPAKNIASEWSEYLTPNRSRTETGVKDVLEIVFSTAEVDEIYPWRATKNNRYPNHLHPSMSMMEKIHPSMNTE
jgi:hypothetical protein